MYSKESSDTTSISVAVTQKTSELLGEFGKKIFDEAQKTMILRMAIITFAKEAKAMNPSKKWELLRQCRNADVFSRHFEDVLEEKEVIS